VFSDGKFKLVDSLGIKSKNIPHTSLRQKLQIRKKIMGFKKVILLIHQLRPDDIEVQKRLNVNCAGDTEV